MRLTKNKDIIFELSRKQIKTQYRDSTLGFLWTILNPLLNMLIMWVVFQNVLGIKDPYYPIYLLAGNILFAAIRASTSQALSSIVDNRGLLLRTKMDLDVFPISNVMTSIVNFAFSLIALVPFMIWLSIQQNLNLFTFRLLFILLMIPPFLIFEYGIGLFLAAIFVFFRDLKHLYAVFLTLWNYLTPIFYTVDRIDKNSITYRLITLNPMYHYVNYFRDSVYRGATGIDVFSEYIGPYVPLWSTYGYLWAFAGISLIIGYITYKALENKIITKI